MKRFAVVGSILPTTFTPAVNGASPWLTVQAERVAPDADEILFCTSTRAVSLGSGLGYAGTAGLDLAVGTHDGNFGIVGSPFFHQTFNLLPDGDLLELGPIPTRGKLGLDSKVLVSLWLPPNCAYAFSAAVPRSLAKRSDSRALVTSSPA